MRGFRNSNEHLMAEIARMDLRIRIQVVRWRERIGQAAEDEFRGLYISEQEMDSLLAAGPPVGMPEPASPPDEVPFSRSLRQLEAEIAERKARTLEEGIPLRLVDLAAEFGLSDFEVDALLLCLLPEISVRYERLYGYLHDDVTRKRPSIHLVLECTADRFEDRLKLRESFLPHAPLLAYHLLSLDDENRSGPVPLLARALKIDDRIASYLLGSDAPDPRLTGAQLIRPAVSPQTMILAEEARSDLERMARILRQESNLVVHLQGPAGAGKKTAAEALSGIVGLPLLLVDVAALSTEGLSIETLVTLAFREARLQHAALAWDRFDSLLSNERAVRVLTAQTLTFPHPVFLLGHTSWQPGDVFAGKGFLRFKVETPPYAVRRRLWEARLDGNRSGVSSADMDEIADKFRFTPGAIRDAAAVARDLARGRGEGAITAADLYAACRATSNHKLGQLARKIIPRHRWDDIVLPKDQAAQLHEISNYIRFRHLVFDTWRFEDKLSSGRGLNILFAGPSGTGKTMAAEILAGELGLDLYKIDLSTVVSKYIGETEKNLDRIFTEAQNSNAILFFDEADAIFGKRSEVRDSHDRYANIEIAYLLQKTEEYEGIVILATNLRKNIDEAFSRRMRFAVEFPQPEEADRLRIWKKIFPPQAPLGPDVDLGFMARQFKITGGNIKNIAIGAAFLAAGDGGVIRMEHLIRAAKREFQKIGRLCTEADFAQYSDLVRG